MDRKRDKENTNKASRVNSQFRISKTPLDHTIICDNKWSLWRSTLRFEVLSEEGCRLCTEDLRHSLREPRGQAATKDGLTGSLHFRQLCKINYYWFAVEVWGFEWGRLQTLHRGSAPQPSGTSMISCYGGRPHRLPALPSALQNKLAHLYTYSRYIPMLFCVFSYLWKEIFHEGSAVYGKHVGFFPDVLFCSIQKVYASMYVGGFKQVQ